MFARTFFRSTSAFSRSMSTSHPVARPASFKFAASLAVGTAASGALLYGYFNMNGVSASPAAKKLELHYFKTPNGRAEFNRLLLEVGGIPYVDVFEGPEEMNKQGRLAFKQLPLLVDPNHTVNGKPLDLVQSMTIARHIARISGLYGLNATEAALIDMVADGANDLKGVLIGVQFYNQPKDVAVNDKIPTHLANFEAHIKQNNGGDGFWVGNKLSYADVLVFEALDDVTRLAGPQALTAFPKLAAFKTRIENIASVKAYLDSPRNLRNA